MLNSFHDDDKFALAGFLIVANDKSYVRLLPDAAKKLERTSQLMAVIMVFELKMFTCGRLNLTTTTSIGKKLV